MCLAEFQCHNEMNAPHKINRTRSTVINVLAYRCVPDCRPRGPEFDPSRVPYLRGDWSSNNFYGHCPPFRWYIQGGFLSVSHRPVIVKSALTGSNGEWKLSTIFKLKSASWLVNNEITGKKSYLDIYICCTFWNNISLLLLIRFTGVVNRAAYRSR